eukprot:4778588-Amphidinium_carterae.1
MWRDIEHGAACGGAPHYNCHMRSTPMGDQKSMDVAQMLHVWTLVSRCILRPELNWMSYRYRCPSSPHWGGCYCDDLGIVSLLSRQLERNLGMVEGSLEREHKQLITDARAAYVDVGIIRKESKAVECATE